MPSIFRASSGVNSCRYFNVIIMKHLEGLANNTYAFSKYILKRITQSPQLFQATIVINFSGSESPGVQIKNHSLETNSKCLYDYVSDLWKNRSSVDNFGTSSTVIFKTNNYNNKIKSRYGEILVSGEEIRTAIRKLNQNESCGLDNIYVEHLQCASTTC